VSTATFAPPPLPALVVGTVHHVRHEPQRREFEHRHYQWLVDVDDLPQLRRPWRWLARFDARDHLDRGRNGSIGADLRSWLHRRGIDTAADDRILMLAHARTLGHVFDPLTVFWCLCADGTTRAVVLEVHNTYGQRHAYLLDLDERGRGSVDKQFYVSPFNDTEGGYAVQVRLDPRRVHVDVRLRRDGRPLITAVVTGIPEPATPARLLRTFVRHAFMTHRVSLLIRWHGIGLWLSRLPIRPRPAHPEDAIR